jgi:hypothetical protein
MGADHGQKPAWLRSAERRGLVSAMNATKWREATEAMRHLPGGPPRFRVKDIDAAVPGDWDSEWYYHPRPYEVIEWVEIDPDRRPEQVRAALAAVGVPVVVVGELVRVLGWLRPGVSLNADQAATADRGRVP